MSEQQIKITLAQLNPTVGDVTGNAAKARAAREKAKADGADLVVLSELFLAGYPPEDLVLKPAFQSACRAAVEELARETKDGGPAMLIGTPWVEDGKLYNACALLDGGRIAALRFKANLPNYGVFDEKRLFARGPAPGPVTVRGVRIGVPICEDIWLEESEDYENVVECLAETGAEILVVPNGSPYHRNKLDLRMGHMVARVVETGLPLVYLNLVGGQDDQVYDGGSFVLNPGGHKVVQMAPFDEGLVHVDFTRTAEDEPLYAIEPVAQGAVNTIVTQGGAVPMKVLANNELQTKDGAHPSERSTRHIEVELPASLKYRVGDHLSVVPRNDPTLVDSAARRFGFLPADQIRLQVSEGRRAQLPVGNAVSVGRLLTEFVELQQVATRKQIQIMAEHTRCPVTKPKLTAYVGDDDASAERYRTEVLAKRKSVFDLLEEYPACELPFHLYLEMLSLLAPRYYSISSSPAGEAQRCSVTVGVVEAPASSGHGIYKGVCSNYLARRRAGDTVHATIKETKAGFRLPDDNAVPIIMIGPGTGLAPFRGFLQERAARKVKGATLGPAMLFFGCRHPEQDFIYADELKAFAADGVTELHTAFSRAEGPKTYVQHLVAAQKDRVWELIEKGAIVYVCGDGGKMEPDVKATLMSIYRERAGADADAAARWIEEMGTGNRYVLDVWAGG